MEKQRDSSMRFLLWGAEPLQRGKEKGKKSTGEKSPSERTKSTTQSKFRVQVR